MLKPRYQSLHLVQNAFIISLFKMFSRWILGIFNAQLQSERVNKSGIKRCMQKLGHHILRCVSKF